MKRLVLLASAGAVLLAGCTSSADPQPAGSTGTVTSTVTSTRDTGTDYRPPTPTYVPALPAGKKVPAGEKAGRCPYIRSGLNEDPTDKPNVADIQGNRVGRTTVLTELKPVGCRFYFAYAPGQAVADIRPTTFATAAQARNAMILTAQAGKQVMGVRNFVPGVDGISYRTKFIAADKGRDWAFAFAKGRVLVVVHTEEVTTSQNALFLAKAVAAEF